MTNIKIYMMDLIVIAIIFIIIILFIQLYRYIKKHNIRHGKLLLLCFAVVSIIFINFNYKTPQSTDEFHYTACPVQKSDNNDLKKISWNNGLLYMKYSIYFNNTEDIQICDVSITSLLMSYDIKSINKQVMDNENVTITVSLRLSSLLNWFHKDVEIITVIENSKVTTTIL